MTIEVLYQDEHYIAVSKPSGLLVHPFWRETNERDNLMVRVRDQIDQYLYPVHRIDRPVSGIVIFGLSSEAAGKIKEGWHLDSTIKRYIALTRGTFEEDEGTFDFQLSNEKKVKQDAITHYKVLDRVEKFNLVQAKIDTGRKHQIRRHFSRTAHQIIGDTAHGKGQLNRYFRDEYSLNRIFLHSYELEFIHPYTNEKIEITAPLTEDLKSVIERLGFSWRSK